ncbi:hypothetical protein [Shimia sp.]|uniref:hypothetical protein n=1 Tax=unclassified Shimia TaxID=2630038 RepID=UPI0025DCBAFF|nr:hypothetical protein [Shimia sp.]MCH2067499.1 hypothetical protein [Shimia sp.]
MTSLNRFKSLKFWLKHAIWFVPTAYVLNFIYAISSDQTGGTFGDTFGAANALFSGTALLMLVLAVTLQREELEQVKEERNDTRELLKGQEELTELQKKALEKQIFEQTFGSFLTSALSEKARLDIKPVVNNREESSPYFNAALFAKRLLEMAANDEDPFNQNSVNAAAYVTKCFILANMLLHIDNLIRRTCPEDELVHLSAFFESLIEDEIAYCIAWFACKAKHEHQDQKSLEEFIERYKFEGRLSAAAWSGYKKLIS